MIVVVVRVDVSEVVEEADVERERLVLFEGG